MAIKIPHTQPGMRQFWRLEIELNQTQTNYSFPSSVQMYSDRSGFNWYRTDTSNQIAASVYSEKFFWSHRTSEMIGIGFDENGLMPEAIALLSPSYLTTNKGMYNLEYKGHKEFEVMSADYDDLIENDGDSEVVLFRRGMEYDTKASYVFVAGSTGIMPDASPTPSTN